MNAIKKARMVAGLTQIELARMAGVTPGAVCQWETGRSFPDVKRIKVVAQALNTTPKMLVDGYEGRTG